MAEMSGANNTAGAASPVFDAEGAAVDPSSPQVSEAEHRAAAANAALARFAAQAQQGALPTPAAISERKQLDAVRDKLVKALVGTIMDYNRNSPSQASACVHTLLLLISNVLAEPGDEKLRVVKASSNAFSKKIANTHGGEDFLRAASWHKETHDFIASWHFRHRPGTFQWRALELAEKELTKAAAEVEEKERRAIAAQTEASRKKAGNDRQRDILKQQLKEDHEDRKKRFVYK